MTNERMAPQASASKVSASPRSVGPQPAPEHEPQPGISERIFLGYTPPTGDSGNAIRIIPFEKEWPIEGVGKVKVQIRFEANLKRDGELKTAAGKTDVGVAEKKAIVQQKLQRGADRVGLSINNSLIALKEAILESGERPLGGVPVALKVEAKFLDAELTLDELKLNAVKITVSGEGDFSDQVPELADKYKLLGQIRLEVAVSSELVHDLYKLGSATQELKRGVEIQDKLKEGKRALADREKRAAKIRSTKGSLSKAHLERLKILDAEIKDLRGKTGKLQQLRTGAAKGRDAALKVVKDIGGKLGKTKLGSFLARHIAKAVALAFKKVLPVYNVVSTAIDVLEIAEHLVKTTELGNESGEGVAGGKSQAEEQGAGTGTGAGSGAGSGGAGEAPTGEDQGAGTADGGGGGKIESAKPDAPMPDLGTAGLEPAGAVQLTKSAELVMKTLLKQKVYTPSVTLDDSEKAIINAVVPTDLDAEELVALARIMGGKSGAMTPIPQLVIEAMQQVRPDGKKRRTVRPKPPVPTSRPTAPRPKSHPAEAGRRDGCGPQNRQGEIIIDLEGYVADHARLDFKTRQVTLPELAEVRGVTLKLLGALQHMRPDKADDAHWVLAAYKVVRVTDDTDAPRMFNNGTRVGIGVTTAVKVQILPDA
jgi:hypothetical protein